MSCRVNSKKQLPLGFILLVLISQVTLRLICNEKKKKNSKRGTVRYHEETTTSAVCATPPKFRLHFPYSILKVIVDIAVG